MMKTLTRITTLIAIALTISLNTFATGTEFEQEQYIDDIPFDIEEIQTKVLFEQAMEVDFSFEEEEDILDIPFQTIEITSNYTKAISQDFSFDEESYINDIPSVIVSNTNTEFYASAK